MFTMRNTDLTSTLLKMNRASLIKTIVTTYAILLNHAVFNWIFKIKSYYCSISNYKYLNSKRYHFNKI